MFKNTVLATALAAAFVAPVCTVTHSDAPRLIR
jgi:hypothetical protein